MFCSISGEFPQEPVVSIKSGHVFERHLIEKYIAQHSTCPITFQPLQLSDLIPIKVTNPVVRPRAPTSTSVPSLIALFQNEWDSLMFETYSLKQQLDSTKQELSRSLFLYDAACKVIANLIKEKDSGVEINNNGDDARNDNTPEHQQEENSDQQQEQGQDSDQQSEQDRKQEQSDQ